MRNAAPAELLAVQKVLAASGTRRRISRYGLLRSSPAPSSASTYELMEYVVAEIKNL